MKRIKAGVCLNRPRGDSGMAVGRIQGKMAEV